MTSADGEGLKVAAAHKVFRIGQVYLRNATFDAPRVPDMHYGLANGEADNIEFNFDTRTRRFVNNYRELVLIIHIHATCGGDTIFRAVVEEVGIFLVIGFDEEEGNEKLCTEGVEALYPYAQEFIKSMVGRAGVQRLDLPPRVFVRPTEPRT